MRKLFLGAALGAIPIVGDVAAAQCEIDVLVAPDPVSGTGFGIAVAVDGGTAAVGEMGQVGFDFVLSQVTVFERSGPGWVQTDHVQSSDAVAGDFFGFSVALDGDRMLVGAMGQPGGGAAYVFERSGSTWSETARLSLGQVSGGFGRTVALDGDVAVVGAATDSALGQYVGAAHVFELQGGSWVHAQTLRPADGEARDYFGSDVAVSGDYVVAGSPGESSAGARSGAAYVFEDTTAGWVEVAKLVAADADIYDSFGTSVALEGNDLFVGAIGANYDGTSVGAAYRFEQTIFGWEQTHKLLPSDVVPTGYFGADVDVSGDRLVVGADNSAPEGAAYVFVREGGDWVERAKLRPSAQGFDGFGNDVAIGGDDVLVGASTADGPVPSSGVAYAYELDQLPYNYCVGAPNSAGPGARIASSGTLSVGENDLRLLASGAIPGQFGVFFYGPTQIQAPFGDGFRCVGGGTFRLIPPLLADGAGGVSRLLDFGEPPAGSGPGEIQPGDAWNFQFWYRDPAMGGSGFNLSDALSAVFCP